MSNSEYLPPLIPVGVCHGCSSQWLWKGRKGGTGQVQEEFRWLEITQQDKRRKPCVHPCDNFEWKEAGQVWCPRQDVAGRDRRGRTASCLLRLTTALPCAYLRTLRICPGATAQESESDIPWSDTSWRRSDTSRALGRRRAGAARPVSSRRRPARFPHAPCHASVLWTKMMENRATWVQ